MTFYYELITKLLLWLLYQLFGTVVSLIILSFILYWIVWGDLQVSRRFCKTSTRAICYSMLRMQRLYKRFGMWGEYEDAYRKLHNLP